MIVSLKQLRILGKLNMKYDVRECSGNNMHYNWKFNNYSENAQTQMV